MKNVIIVSKQGCALVAQGNTVVTTKSSVGHFIANLQAVKEVLLTIPESTNLSETTNIMVSDVIQGLVSGTAIEYIKTGKTAGGNILSAEEVGLFKEVYELYATRLLNIKFSQHKYIKTTDTTNQGLKKFAYDELDKYIAQNGVVRNNTAVATTTVVDPDKELRDMFDAQIKEAMIAKDMALVKELMTMRNELKAPETVTTAQAPVANANATQFDKSALLNSLSKDETPAEETPELGDPIVFTKTEGQPQW